MTKEEYLERIEHLSKLLNFPIGEFFDLEFSPYKDEYLEVITFYDKTLKANADYGIEPAFIYLNGYRTRNAKAGKLNGNYLISINAGLILWLIQNIRDEQRIDKAKIPLFNILRPHLDIPISKLMYQTAVHFTFYHEMAHLIQQSDLLNLHLDERPKCLKEYSEQRHLLELDADEYSALCVGVHSLDYHQRLFGKGSKPVLEALLIVICIPIVLYILSFYGNDEDLYLFENTHPHPSIRLMIVSLVIVDYCNQSLSIKGRKFQVDHLFIIEQALRITKFFEESFLATNRIDNLLKIIRENLKEIMSYAEHFKILKEGNTTLAVYKRNEIIKKNARKE